MKTLLPVLAGFFIMGFCDLVGVATSYVQREFSLSESVSGLIPSMVFLWFLLLSVPVAYWMNRMGRRRMVIVGNVVTMVGMMLPLADYSFSMCLAAFALLGIGNTVLQVSLNPLLASVVDSKSLSSSLTAGQVIKAVSSFCGPFVIAFAAQSLGNWVWMFPIFAGVTLISTIWLTLTHIEEPLSGGSRTISEVFSVLKNGKVRILFLGIVAIVGIDVGLNTLAPKLLIASGIALESAGFGSSVYFLCRLAGAFVGTLLLARMSDRTYYFVHVLAGIAVLGTLFMVENQFAILVCLGIEGFAFSSIFSVIYSQALKTLPDRANEISGLMITGVCGGAIVPPLMGLMTDAMGSQAGSLIVVMLFACYLVYCGSRIKTSKSEENVQA